MSKYNGDRQASDIQPELLTAYALGQLHGEELATVKAALEAGHEAGGSVPQSEVRQVQALAEAITAARSTEPLPGLSVELRAAIESKLAQMATVDKVEPAASQRRWRRPTVVECVVIGGVGVLLLALCLPAVQSAREASRRAQARNDLRQLGLALREEEASRTAAISALVEKAFEGEIQDLYGTQNGVNDSSSPSDTTGDYVTPQFRRQVITELPHNSGLGSPTTAPADPAGTSATYKVVPDGGTVTLGGGRPGPQVTTGPGGTAGYGGPGAMAGSGQAGGYPGTQARGSGGYGYGSAGSFSGDAIGGGKFAPSIANNAVPVTESAPAAAAAELAKINEELHIARAHGAGSQRTADGGETENRKYKFFFDPAAQGQTEAKLGEQGERLSQDQYNLAFRMRAEQKSREFYYGDRVGNEQYERIVENAFLSPLADPLSTFSIDVDTASYANVRRFLSEGRLPPPSAVRIEELVNYFTYSYPQPSGREPFSVNMEAAECPWNAGHLLLRVGLKGKEVHRSERPPSNLTFLLDVSGSMADANKLPLLKTTLMMFVAELSENDRVSIVTYAGEAGLRLPPTRGHEKEKIMAAIDSLSAGGSTHGSAGIQLAYEQAGQYFLKEGTNRVILATDGDLNVGVTSDDALVELIKEKAAGGTFLTVLGFGTGNLKDGKLEKLADNGNGVYAYIDSMREGRKVLVEQMSGNLVTIAKDVKIQIEFNPAQVASYRLLGYENRVLAAADFSNDRKDAGEIGAGHTVTALYELVPVGTNEIPEQRRKYEALKYQADRLQPQRETPPGANRALTDAAASGELLTLKLRYKEPDGVESRLVEFPLKERGGQFHAASKDLQFAAAVASFGMILRSSEHRGSGNLPAVAEIAGGAIGADPSGYRAEFVDLVRKAQSLGAK
ncbi:MAG: von Willebrand factor type A domain-containing protein [Planctomycetaceae bacterium]|nr:von Willebrand factor type A domain-containing protein [Planctomycetaceae bacterium]